MCSGTICCKANMVELKQTKLSDRSTVGRVWDSEFEGYRFDSRNRQIFATSENSKIYFSNIIQIICYLETLICLIIFVNNIDLLQVVLIYSLMSLNVLILRSKNSLQTDCIISRFEYTVFYGVQTRILRQNDNFEHTFSSPFEKQSFISRGNKRESLVEGSGKGKKVTTEAEEREEHRYPNRLRRKRNRRNNPPLRDKPDEIAVILLLLPPAKLLPLSSYHQHIH